MGVEFGLVPEFGQAGDERAWLSARRFSCTLKIPYALVGSVASIPWVFVAAFGELPVGLRFLGVSCVQRNIYSAEFEVWQSTSEVYHRRSIAYATAISPPFHDMVHCQSFDSAQTCVLGSGLYYTTHNIEVKIWGYEHELWWQNARFCVWIVELQWMLYCFCNWCFCFLFSDCSEFELSYFFTVGNALWKDFS